MTVCLTHIACLMSLSPPPHSQFSLFGSRSASRTTNPPSSSSSSSSPVVSLVQSVKKADCQSSVGPGLSKAEFLERVRRSNQACQQGEYALAVRLYTEALTADPQNCILYSNRSAAHLRLGQYGTALDDALKARVINPKWPKVGNVTSDEPRRSITHSKWLSANESKMEMWMSVVDKFYGVVEWRHQSVAGWMDNGCD